METIDNKEILRLKTIWRTKKFTETFDEFIIHYNRIPKSCHYCDITETEINTLLSNNLLYTKRLRTRGRKLEFDRKSPDVPYSNIDNIVLSCYWCNNAKTDTFTEIEFKKIGKSIKEIWRQKLDLLKK